MWGRELAKTENRKSLYLYRLKVSSAPEIFHDNHDASSVFLRARLGASALEWRLHKFDFFALGKLCPICSKADENTNHFHHQCKRPPKIPALSAVLEDSFLNVTSDDFLFGLILSLKGSRKEKPDLRCFSRLAKKYVLNRWLARGAVVREMKTDSINMQHLTDGFTLLNFATLN